MKGRSFTTL